MSQLTEKEIMNNSMKLALDRETHREAKYAFLARSVNDQRFQKMFGKFAETSRNHVAMIKIEMKNLNIK